MDRNEFPESFRKEGDDAFFWLSSSAMMALVVWLVGTSSALVLDVRFSGLVESGRRGTLIPGETTGPFRVSLAPWGKSRQEGLTSVLVEAPGTNLATRSAEFEFLSFVGLHFYFLTWSVSCVRKL